MRTGANAPFTIKYFKPFQHLAKKGNSVSSFDLCISISESHLLS